MNAERAGLAVVAGCTAAMIVYAVLRVAQAILVPEPDPALVLWSAHSGFFWRSWTAAYIGGAAAFLAWLAAGRSAPRVARFLARALPAAAALIALQGLLVP